MSYDKNADVLSLADQSHVVLRDEQGNTTIEFTSAKSTLDRMAHALALDGNVHALRDEQVIEATQGVARLTPDDQRITDMELRGNSRVVGGGSGVDSMSARDMNLHYAPDGKTLEHAQLVGGGAVALTGQNGSPGRQFLGETLDILLAPDGALTKATGRENVRLDLPASADAPARSIKARTLDADGAPGEGLTAARFAENVRVPRREREVIVCASRTGSCAGSRARQRCHQECSVQRRGEVRGAGPAGCRRRSALRPYGRLAAG